MFQPQFQITNQLLANIKRVSVLTQELNHRRLPQVVLLNFQRAARAVSSHASTSIEGNPLPLTEVKRILKSTPAHLRDTEREVINYNLALEELHRLLELDKTDLNISLVLKIHKLVVNGLLPKSDTGKLRQKPVVVNNPKTRQVVYLPPDHQQVPELLSHLLNFVKINQKQLDPLILAGLFHKQMVIIHPFMDGNGRTTRLLTKFLLAKLGVDTFNLFSFENYYNQNVTKYFQVVGEYGDFNELGESIDFAPWLEYFSEGIIDEMLRVGSIVSDFSTSPEFRLEKYHLKILDFIKINGHITDREYAKLTPRAKATRVLDFQKLIDLHLITRQGAGRSTYYVLRED